MRLKRAKIFLLLVIVLFTFFFSNDFGLIDVEKTSIVTAIAVDLEKDEYLVTVQAAVPEATDTNTENQKAQLSGRGKTIGGALKNLGDVSGWFPKLAFCNLIILGNKLADDNVVNVLDYFAKALRIQDSALVVLAEQNAKDLLSISTPLDNISSFAMQKIILKTSGFDKDVCPINIKTFCAKHYSVHCSSFMPIIRVISADNGSGSGGAKQDNSQSSQGESGNQSSSQGAKATGSNADSNNLFNASTTALFKDGKKVGELDANLTLAFNAFYNPPLAGTNVTVDDVLLNGKVVSCLVNIIDDKSAFSVDVKDSDVILNFKLSLYCKINDVNSDHFSESLSQNQVLPQPVIDKLEQMFSSYIQELVDTSIQTECDFLGIKEKLYRYHHSKYSSFKDNYFSRIKTDIKVLVSGTK